MQTTLPNVFLTAALILTTACVPIGTTGGATEAQLCRSWGMSLPTRSRSDTAQTAEEIERGYGDFAAACPDHVNLIPGRE